jgi:putative DNA primase/helicase
VNALGIKEAVEGAEQAAPDDQSVLLDRNDPMPSAKAFVATFYRHEDMPTLHRHRGAFYAWAGTHYLEVSDAEIRAGLYKFLNGAEKLTKEGKREPFKPTATSVTYVHDALKAITHRSDRDAAPLWLDDRSEPPPSEMLACRNGLLHLPGKRLLSSTPAFFGLNAVDFDYDEHAPEPSKWLAFLGQLWPRDPESIECLQEIFGYLLTQDTAHQKAFLLVGPKRSGKGTIGRVLEKLLGTDNVTGPTLAGLGTNFGLAPLIGKPLAIISDARLSGRADLAVIAERLLSITGEDALTIDRKFRDAWTGTLPTRFLILTNELPRIADASGALVSRFIVLTLVNTFYGREDLDLTKRLLTELPGILNWSIAGLERLQRRGRFQQPKSARGAIQELEDLGSPISAFIRERCTVGPGKSVLAQTLYSAWTAWCEAQGRDHSGTVQTFGRDLRAVVPWLNVTQPRSAGQARTYEGIALGQDPARHAVTRVFDHCTRSEEPLCSRADSSEGYNALERVSSRVTLAEGAGDAPRERVRI